MPAGNTPSPVSPPYIRVSIRNDSPQAEADYLFYQVISDDTHSFRIELIEDPDPKKASLSQHQFLHRNKTGRKCGNGRGFLIGFHPFQ